MGDKACEMKVVGFDNYMQLADRIQERFPDLNSLWLSTEMQASYSHLNSVNLQAYSHEFLN